MRPTTRPPFFKQALRTLPWLAAVLLALLLFRAYALHRELEALRGRYEPELAALREGATRDVDFFCEQQELLSADPWFHEPRTEGDAGPLLNAWVTWDPKPGAPEDSPLAIPDHLPQRDLGQGTWLSQPVDVSGLDFGWMRRLHAYDRWDLLLNSPVPRPERVDWANEPIPDMVPLQAWAKYRLLHGLGTGQPLEAARDVRHLAWLLYRTDTVLGGAMAAALLSFEREAHDSLADPPADWRPMSRAQVERMRALVMSGSAFSSIAVPPDVARRARRCGAPAVGRCIALAEAAFMAKYVQPFARDTYREACTALEEDLAAFPCATSVTRTLWERGVTMQDVEVVERRKLGGWGRMVPRRFVDPYLADLVLVTGGSGLRRLHEYRETLTASAPEERR